MHNFIINFSWVVHLLVLFRCVCVVMESASASLPVHLSTSLPVRFFVKFGIRDSLKSVEKVRIWLKLDKIVGHSTGRPKYI